MSRKKIGQQFACGFEVYLIKDPASSTTCLVARHFMRICLLTITSIFCWLIFESCNEKTSRQIQPAVRQKIFAKGGQTINNGKGVGKSNSFSKDTTTIYRNISLETCDCTFSTMKNNKPSTSMDSCYKAALLKYNDTLKQLGFDPATQVGEVKLANEVIGKLYGNCPDLSNLIQKEYADENAKKLFFKGELVSQTKLSSGLYEIVMKSVKSKEIKTFFAKNPLDEKQIKKYEPGYELTFEYEVLKDRITQKDEYFLKEYATVRSIGAVKVTTPK